MRIPDIGQGIQQLAQSIGNLNENISRADYARRSQELNNGLAQISNQLVVEQRSLMRNYEDQMARIETSVDFRNADFGTQYATARDDIRERLLKPYESDKELYDQAAMYLDQQFFNFENTLYPAVEERYQGLIAQETVGTLQAMGSNANWQGIDSWEAQMLDDWDNQEQWDYAPGKVRELAAAAREMAAASDLSSATSGMAAESARDYILGATGGNGAYLGDEARQELAESVYQRQKQWQNEQDTANNERAWDIWKNVSSYQGALQFRELIKADGLGYMETGTQQYWVNQADATIQNYISKQMQNEENFSQDVADTAYRRLNQAIFSNNDHQTNHSEIMDAYAAGMITTTQFQDLIKENDNRNDNVYVTESFNRLRNEWKGTQAELARAQDMIWDEIDRIVQDNSNGYGSVAELDNQTLTEIMENTRRYITDGVVARRVENGSAYDSFFNNDRTFLNRRNAAEIAVDAIDNGMITGVVEEYAETLDVLKEDFRKALTDSILSSQNDRYGLYGLFGNYVDQIPEKDALYDRTTGRIQVFIPSNNNSEYLYQLDDGRTGYIVSMTLVDKDIAPVIYNPNLGDGSRLEDYVDIDTAKVKIHQQRFYDQSRAAGPWNGE